MKPGIIYFDCAGTLLHPAEAVGGVYARTAAAFGFPRDPRETETRFRAAWKKAARPVYPGGPDEEVDRAWWRGLVKESLFPADGAGAGTGTTPGFGVDTADCTDGAGGAGAEAGNSGGSGPGGAAFDDCFAELFRHYARPEAWRVYPEVIPVLEALRGKVRLGALSNFDARLYPLLDGHGLSRFFETVVLSSESAACKPDPAIFTRAAALAGLPPEDCLLAGDDPVNDWQGAAAAGWRVFRLRRPENSLTGLPGAAGIMD